MPPSPSACPAPARSRSRSTTRPPTSPRPVPSLRPAAPTTGFVQRDGAAADARRRAVPLLRPERLQPELGRALRVRDVGRRARGLADGDNGQRAERRAGMVLPGSRDDRRRPRLDRVRPLARPAPEGARAAGDRDARQPVGRLRPGLRVQERRLVHDRLHDRRPGRHGLLPRLGRRGRRALRRRPDRARLRAAERARGEAVDQRRLLAGCGGDAARVHGRRDRSDPDARPEPPDLERRDRRRPVRRPGERLPAAARAGIDRPLLLPRLHAPPSRCPGDAFNGLQVRLDQCAAIDKPLVVGEAGVKPIDVGGTLADRAAAIRAKLLRQVPAGVEGWLGWAWIKDGSTLDNYDIGPGDPMLGVLSAFGDYEPAAGTRHLRAGRDDEDGDRQGARRPPRRARRDLPAPALERRWRLRQRTGRASARSSTTTARPRCRSATSRCSRASRGRRRRRSTSSLTAPSGRTITVDFATAGVTATAGVDFQSAVGTLTFAPGQERKTITVLVNGDETVEPERGLRGPAQRRRQRDRRGRDRRRHDPHRRRQHVSRRQRRPGRRARRGRVLRRGRLLHRPGRQHVDRHGRLRRRLGRPAAPAGARQDVPARAHLCGQRHVHGHRGRERRCHERDRLGQRRRPQRRADGRRRPGRDDRDRRDLLELGLVHRPRRRHVDRDGRLRRRHRRPAADARREQDLRSLPRAMRPQAPSRSP